MKIVSCHLNPVINQFLTLSPLWQSPEIAETIFRGEILSQFCTLWKNKRIYRLELQLFLRLRKYWLEISK